MNGSIRVTSRGLTVSFPYSPISVAKVKALAEMFGARKPFDPETKTWTLPLRSAARLRETFPSFDADQKLDELAESVRHEEEEQELRNRQRKTKVAERMDIIHRPLRNGRVLYEHQKVGVQWLVERCRGILGDDMGLGKTIESLVAARIIREAMGTATACIVPANKIEDWRDEADMVGLTPYIFSWAKIPSAGYVPRPFVLIADEAHYAQTMTAKRTQQMLELAAVADAVFLLTGTPMRGRKPTNLFPLLKAIRHPLSDNRGGFERRYCDAKPTKFSKWDTSGAANLLELHEKTKGCILRRLKTECLDLPPKTRVMEKVVPSGEDVEQFQAVLRQMTANYKERQKEKMDLYRREGRTEAEIQMAKMADATVALSHIRQAASLAKVPSACEMAEDVIEGGGQVLMFTEFRQSALQIGRHFGLQPFIGGLTPELQSDMKRRFQSGELKVLPGTSGALGTGHNLTAANTVIMVDRPLTPGDAEQAEDRCYRIGQQWPVTSYWLRAFTVDVRIDELLAEKSKVIAAVMDGKETGQLSRASLSPDAIMGWLSEH